MTVNRLPIESPKEPLKEPIETEEISIEFPKEPPKEPIETEEISIEIPKEPPKEPIETEEISIEIPKELEDPIDVLASQQNISYNTAKTVLETRKALEEATLYAKEMAEKYHEISKSLELQLEAQHKKTVKALEEARKYSEECSKAVELLKRKSNPIPPKVAPPQ